MNRYMVEYSVNLGELYHSKFNSIYYRTDIIVDGDIVDTKDGFTGYFNYRCTDKEDEQRAKREARDMLSDFLDEMIYSEDVFTKIKNINYSKYVNKIELKPTKRYYTDKVEFTLTTTVNFI